MRYGPTDTFWVVVDPTPDSGMEDILFQASLKDLDLQFKGGHVACEGCGKEPRRIVR